jgi:hypothetical protein
MTEDKKWEKPVLNVLVRSRSEETVLTVCKVQGMAGPGVTDERCMRGTFETCSVISAS